MSKLAEYLNRHILGNVFDRLSIREAYATDRSILKITPRLVAVPETANDIRKLLRFTSQLASREFELPVTVRGTGLDKTGASIGSGLIMSTEKLNQIEEIDLRGRLVRVQPGITLRALNTALQLQGLWLPIDYDPDATIGGLIANCPVDGLARRYGGIYHFVERAEVVLSSGDLIQLAPYNLRMVEAKIVEDTAEGRLYREIERILDEYADTILDRTMRPFDAIGYANITHVRTNRSLNLLPLLFASQGTLGVISDVILRVEPLPSASRRMLISFHDLKAAQRFLNYARDLDPSTLKVYDLRILEKASEHGKKPDLFIRKLGKGMVVTITFNYSRLVSKRKIRRCLEALPENTFYVEETPENAEAFQSLNNSLLSFLNDDGRGERTPILDDVFVPSMHFGDFLEGLKNLERTLGADLPVYGSFATSSYTVRPDFDCTTIDGRKKTVDFLKLYSELVDSCQGSITANGPEGRVKALMMSKTLGVGERQLYNSIKEAFDPLGVLNPKVKLGADVRDTIRHLRTSEKRGIIAP